MTKSEGSFSSLQVAKELQEFDGIGFVSSGWEGGWT